MSLSISSSYCKSPKALMHSQARPYWNKAPSVTCVANYGQYSSSIVNGKRRANNALASKAPAVKQVDFLVLGSGIAGLSYALKVAEYGKVAIVTKHQASEGSTQYAQGGICAVLDKTDCVADHAHDTMVAGAFLNDAQAVDVVCREGPARVMELVEFGAKFTLNKDGSLHLTREGGHNNRRIVHAADATGMEIERALLHQTRIHPNISFFEHHLAIDFITDEVSGVPHCFGADVLDQETAAITRFVSLATMLATGGAGQVYPNTTNPHVSTGDGMAMAYRAGASISNMEFVQFHPTALYTPGSSGRVFLISEALRGEGAYLFNAKKERFMVEYDPRLELAPRDIVARAIQDQMKKTGSPHVWLDISHKSKEHILSHFPNIASKCLEHGIDITKDPIPVLPAQHYMCGGVQTGLLGETNVQGLYACGEVACSGLHGANRLASNSLLEGLVFGHRAVNPSVAHAEYALRNCSHSLLYATASADSTAPKGPAKPTSALDDWIESRRTKLRETMWRCAGIVRRTGDLYEAQALANTILLETTATREAYGVSAPLIELQNLATAAELIVSCALLRKESRGLHYSVDYPESCELECKPSILSKSLVDKYQTAMPSPSSSVVANQVLNGSKFKKKAPARERDLSVRFSQSDI